jgi:hypothetical protein
LNQFPNELEENAQLVAVCAEGRRYWCRKSLIAKYLIESQWVVDFRDLQTNDGE